MLTRLSGGSETRTHRGFRARDACALRYPLESSEMDLNHRPSPYQSDALTNCAIRGEEGCGRADKIRTCDPLIPNQVRYQTALQPAVTAAVSVGVSYVVATGRPWGTRKGQRC